MQTTPRISACIIARNEEKTIGRAIASLSFADEIILIDAESTDATQTVAKETVASLAMQKDSHIQSASLHIHLSAWRGFAHQRNIALEKSSGDWVFFLDADEQASKELGLVLKKIANDDLAEHPNCYSIQRNEYFLGKLLKYGPGNPSFQWRFFKRKGVYFEGDVHEFPRFDGKIGLIHAAIDHYPSLSVDRFLAKMNHYTTLEALDRFAQGQRTSLIHAFGTFFSTFLKNGIRYRGFLNGKEGLILILLESFSRVVRHLKLWVFWQVYEGKIKIELNQVLPQPGSALAPQKKDLEREVGDSWKK